MVGSPLLIARYFPCLHADIVLSFLRAEARRGEPRGGAMNFVDKGTTQRGSTPTGRKTHGYRAMYIMYTQSIIFFWIFFEILFFLPRLI